MKTLRSFLFACALGTLSGCSGPDFPAYNELDGFRVLAVRATPPDLVPGSGTQLDALVFDAGAAVTQRWSLCPWPSNPNYGFACEVDQNLWEAVWIEAGLQDPPPLALGDGDLASLAIPDNLAGLRAACRGLLVHLGASATLPPDCEGAWNWTIRLSATSNGTAIEAIKNLPVLLAAAPERNQNPRIDELTVVVDGSELDSEEIVLKHNRKVDLRIAIDSGQAETYTPLPVLEQPTSELKPRSEALIFTWFVEGGETDRIRSVFREGVESLADASSNQWRTPKTGGAAAWFVVVRDNRGGVDFVRGNALFED